MDACFDVLFSYVAFFNGVIDKTAIGAEWCGVHRPTASTPTLASASAAYLAQYNRRYTIGQFFWLFG